MMRRRDFLGLMGAAAGTLALRPDRALARALDTRALYFGVHPFIEAHPEAVFILRTQVASKLDGAAKKQVGMDFGSSVFVPMDTPGFPVTDRVAIKPNLTCRKRSHPSYTIERSMGIVTDAFFVEGLVESMKTLGLAGGQFHVREVNCPDDLADGGWLDMAARTGIDLQALNAPVGSLPPGAVQWVDVPDGVWFNRLPFLWPVNAPGTFLLNVAKLKAHSMGLTLCAKNLQGAICARYVEHCTYYGTAMNIDYAHVRSDANEVIQSNYTRHVADGIPRWDRPGTTGGLWQETWATRCLDTQTVTRPALHVIEGIYGRDGNFMDGPSAEGLATDYLTNVIVFGKDPFRVDVVGHWLGGHEPGDFGLFHLAIERGLSTALDPMRVPVYEWHADGSAVPTALTEFTRTPLKTLYLRRDYAGQTEDYWHLVNEPYPYPAAVPDARGHEPLALGNAFPNPFRRSTSVAFSLPRDADARLDVVDVAGRVVAVLADGRLAGGSHLARWDAARQASGMYFCRLRTAGFQATRPLALVR